MRRSPMSVSVVKRRSISHWPADATSWWCTSTSLPASFIFMTKSERKSCRPSDGIDRRGAGIGDEEHVAFIDGLESANAAAIKPHPFDEHALVQFVRRRREMLPGPHQVGEPEVHHLNPLPAAEVDHLRRIDQARFRGMVTNLFLHAVSSCSMISGFEVPQKTDTAPPEGRAPWPCTRLYISPEYSREHPRGQGDLTSPAGSATMRGERSNATLPVSHRWRQHDR